MRYVTLRWGRRKVVRSGRGHSRAGTCSARYGVCAEVWGIRARAGLLAAVYTRSSRSTDKKSDVARGSLDDPPRR